MSIYSKPKKTRGWQCWNAPLEGDSCATGGSGTQGPPGAQGPLGPIGPVGMTWKGGWSNSLNYSVRDTVFYNGSCYFCTTAIAASNNDPASTPSNWDLVALKGNTGTTGIQGVPGPPGPVGPAGLNWQGAWSASGSYVVDDAVGYNGASYFCIDPVAASAIPPDVDTTNWALLAAQGAQGNAGVQGVQGDPGDPGAIGPAGPANTLIIGTVNSGPSPAASITGTAPNQTLNLTLPVGPAGPAGAVTSLTVESGLRNIGDLANPILRLGQNPLLANTEIPTNSAGYSLSVSGTGKFGVGLDMSATAATAKTQVRANAGAFGITGTAIGTTLTVTNPGTYGVNYQGTINIGDYLFCYGASGVKWGTYITANPSAGVYTLNQAVSGTITATGGTSVTTNPSLFTGNGVQFATVPLSVKVEKASAAGNVLETWSDGSMRVTGSVSQIINTTPGGVLVNSTPATAMLYSASTNTFAISTKADTSNPLSDFGNLISGSVCARNGVFLTNVYLGGGNYSGVYDGGNITFNRSGFSQIYSLQNPGGLTPSYDLNYFSSQRHRFTGRTAVSGTSDAFGIMPSAFGGTDYTEPVNGGARSGYSLSVYQPLTGTVSYSITGYIIGTKLYVTGCNATGTIPAGILQVGHSLSARNYATPPTGILEGTRISNIVTPWIPGVTPLPGNPCVTTQVGEYDLLVNGGATGQTFASLANPLGITGSAYPAWNDTRAMYVDGTIKFKNLPQGSGPAPQSPPVGLTSGDIWHDTNDNVIKIVP